MLGTANSKQMQSNGIKTVSVVASEVTGSEYIHISPIWMLLNMRPLVALMNSANSVLGVSLIDKVFPSVFRRALHFLSIKWLASALVAEFVLSDCQESISN